MQALKYELLTALVAMVPVIEVRGAVPMGVGWGLSPLSALVAAVLGSMLPAPFVILLLRRVLVYLRARRIFPRFVDWLETHVRKKGGKVQRYSLPGLFLLVAIPLPGTGVWTGSMVASLLNLPCRRALPVIAAGTAVASLLMVVLTYGVSAVF